jgi:DivIVA domain-containing protein
MEPVHQKDGREDFHRMPDQHDASSEHALIQEIAEPLSKLPDDPVQITADVQFPVVLRGYDRIAVDAYVKRASQLVAELQSTRSPEAAVRRALERVGEEVSGILQRAHESAEKITVHSRADAEDRLERARSEALELTADAERRVADLDAETDAIWAERRRIVADVNALASQLTELAQSALERFPAADTGDEPELTDTEAERETEDRADAEPGMESDAAPTIALHGLLPGGDQDPQTTQRFDLEEAEADEPREASPADSDDPTATHPADRG